MGITPCCSFKGMKRGVWTPHEDSLLRKHIQSYGEGNWRTLPVKAGLFRCGKGCRLRWMNYLRPNVKRGHISSDEEEMIIRLHKLLGNRWSLIAGRIPGRTDNEVKNYWNTQLSKSFHATKILPGNVTRNPRKQCKSDDKNGEEKGKTRYIAETSFTEDGDEYVKETVGSAVFCIEETACLLTGTHENVSSPLTYVGQDVAEPIESSMQLTDGSDDFADIRDFSNGLENVNNVTWPYHDALSSMSVSCVSGLILPAFDLTASTSVCYDDSSVKLVSGITNYGVTPTANNSIMQFHNSFSPAQYTHIQIPTHGYKMVDYDNLVEGETEQNTISYSTLQPKDEYADPLLSLSGWFD